MSSLTDLISTTARNFTRNNTASYAAAIAYHAIISLAPLLLFAIATASRFVGTDTATAQILNPLEGLVGTAISSVVEEVAEHNTLTRTGNVVISLIIIGITLYSASNVFRQLVIALNVIWEIPVPSVRIRDGFLKWATVRLRRYVVGFGLTLVVILALLALVIVNVFVGYFIEMADRMMPDIQNFLLLSNLAVLPVLVLFCLALFKILPATDIHWREVSLGAILTGSVLTIGQGAIGFYASRSRIPDLYGVAGSVVILMLWAYFSALILLIGAEFTFVYSRQFSPENKEQA